MQKEKSSKFKSKYTDILRKSSTLSPDILYTRKEREADNISKVINDRLVDNFWHNQRDFYLYSVLIGNTVDGMPLTMHYAGALSGGVYQLIHFLTCLLFVLPIKRLEYFYGDYTKLTDSQIYRMAPIFLGFPVVVLIVNLIYITLMIRDIAMLLLAAIINLIHALERCPGNTPTCYSVSRQGPLNTTCYKDYIGMKCDGYEQNIQYIGLYKTWEFVMNNDDGLGNWQMLLVSIMTCVFIVIWLYMGIRLMSIFLLVTCSLYSVANILLLLIATIKNVNISCLNKLVTFDFGLVTIKEVFMAIGFTTFKLGLIKPTGAMTHAAYVAKWKFNSAITTTLVIVIHWLVNIFNMVIIYSLAGFIAEEMNVDCSAVIPYGPILFPAIYNEFLSYNNVPPILISLLHVLHWLLEISKLSITIHMLILNFNDLQPRLTRFKRFVIPLIAIFACIMSLCVSLHFIIDSIIPILSLYQKHTEQFLLLAVETILLFYCYGSNRVCNDIHYNTGCRPLIVLFSYSLVCPIILLLCIYFTCQPIHKSLVNEAENSYRYAMYLRMLFISMDLSVIAFSSFIYTVVHLKRKKPFVELVKPGFYFGPPLAIARMDRKHFLPHISMRSQFVKKRIVHYRHRSIYVRKRIDELTNRRQGRIFIEDDGQFHEKPQSYGNYQLYIDFKDKLNARLE